MPPPRDPERLVRSLRSLAAVREQLQLLHAELETANLMRRLRAPARR